VTSALIGVDVGATTISAGLVAPDGTVLSAVQAATPGAGRPPDTVRQLARELAAEARERGLAPLGIGVGLPGLVDAAKGMMVNDGNFAPEFAYYPLADLLEAATGLPAFVDNDVNVLALAERAWGLGQDVGSMALLAIGTGVGGAVIVGDTLVRGHAGAAGEFAHLPTQADGPSCLTGHQGGCLAGWLGGRGIAMRAREGAGDSPGSALWRLAGGSAGAIEATHVFQAARDGDAAASTLVTEVCIALGMSLAAIMQTVNPELIVLTGGVAGSLVPLEAEIRRQTARYALPRAFAKIERAVALSDDGRPLGLEHFSERIRATQGAASPVTLNEALERLKRRMIEDALRECGSKTRAAERLGLSRQSLQQMLRRRQGDERT
jgi:glucokinase